jgi:hypothetical protein
VLLVPSTSSMNQAFDTNASTALWLILRAARDWIALVRL